MITITTAEQLKNIAEFTAEYELGADIDLAGIDWIPLGATATQSSTSVTAFTGTFNGNGHAIKNLTISRSTSDKYNFVGLFGRMGGTVQNLVIKDASITVKGANPCIGILAGYSYSNTPNITNVSVSGTITVDHDYLSTEYAFRGVGGFVGSVYSSTRAKFTDCISNVNINISGDSSRSLYVGGFIGYGNGVTLTRCFAFGNITVTNTADTSLIIGGMQSLCYNTTHNNCACAVNIIGATEGTVSQCCKYLTSTSSFTSNNSRRVWANASVSWESYSSSSDVSFTETDMETIIGADNLSKYNTDNLDFANGKYLKLVIDTETAQSGHDITISGVTYHGVKSVVYNGAEIFTLVVNGITYEFGGGDGNYLTDTNGYVLQDCDGNYLEFTEV